MGLTTNALEIVMNQFEAHNRHDLEAQKAFFDDTCRWVDRYGSLIRENMDDFIEDYGSFMKRCPKLHIEVKYAFTSGDVVIVEEVISGAVNKEGQEVPPYSCLVAYRIKDSKIATLNIL